MAKFSDAAADIFYLSGLTDSDTNVNLIIYITDDNSTFLVIMSVGFSPILNMKNVVMCIPGVMLGI